MFPPGFEFELLHIDRRTGARRGRLSTPRGTIELPAFMPVGTQGTVKGLTPDQVARTGAQILLGNTYHLAIRPGADRIERLGGLHAFMNWPHPILTDSGGFQLFSLAQLTRITEAGATFRSHVDGAAMELTPESSVRIQEQLGSDIAMVFDHLIQLPSSPAEVREATERTVRWAERCRDAHTSNRQVQFAIVQGGLDPHLRQWCAERLRALDFPGYAIGGLSVGETAEEMYETIEATVPHLPEDRPRYLMGVGTPANLLHAIRRGVDMFDCVMPTRNGRNSMAFTDEGPIKLRNARFQDDPRPVQEDLESECRPFSRVYLRHLFRTGEMLGPILLSIHNLAYYQRLMADARRAIEADQFGPFMEQKLAGWAKGV